MIILWLKWFNSQPDVPPPSHKLAEMYRHLSSRYLIRKFHANLTRNYREYSAPASAKDAMEIKPKTTLTLLTYSHYWITSMWNKYKQFNVCKRYINTQWPTLRLYYVFVLYVGNLSNVIYEALYRLVHKAKEWDFLFPMHKQFRRNFWAVVTIYSIYKFC